MKRGQGPSTIFLMVLSVIILVLITYFGYKYLNDFKKSATDSSLLIFEKSLKRDVDIMKQQIGSASSFEYSVPSELSEICFVDLTNVKANDIINHNVIKTFVKTKEKYDVFIKIDKAEKPFLDIPGIRLENEPYYLCYSPVGGKVKISLTGDGSSVLIHMPPNRVYCRNADNSTLCSGLDIAFYYGYKASCCKEYNLCC